jgi:hypothetical protein
VRVGEEFDDLEIKTRGLTDQYHDARAAKLRRAALQHGGDVNKLPLAVTRRILVECLGDHVLLDVRNLENESGEPVSFDQFKALLAEPDYADLVVAALKAAAQVGLTRQAETEDAVKN